MRPGEAISAAALLGLIVLSWRQRLQRGRQQQIIGLGIVGTGAILCGHLLSIPCPKSARVVGDWLPSLLMLVVYWQAGRFCTSPNRILQNWLEDFDRRRIGLLLRRWERSWSATWIGAYFELAYLFCYALIPLGVAALYLVHLRAMIDTYWATILTATYPCYLLVPFVPTVPPRLSQPQPNSRSKTHAVNLFILRHASIQLNTFPSAHVASTFAGSLVLLRALPLAGDVFLAISLSIAIGAVLGRYHYLPDVVLGALLPLAVSQAILG